MKKNSKEYSLETFDRFRELETEYRDYAQRFVPFAEFLEEYEYQKGIGGITQNELAERIGTTQSAVSRFESMKHPPSYDFLLKTAQAFGDRLFLSPAASVSISLPYDLREIAMNLATSRGISVTQLMKEMLRAQLLYEVMSIEKIESEALETTQVLKT